MPEITFTRGATYRVVGTDYVFHKDIPQEVDDETYVRLIEGDMFCGDDDYDPDPDPEPEPEPEPEPDPDQNQQGSPASSPAMATAPAPLYPSPLCDTPTEDAIRKMSKDELTALAEANDIDISSLKNNADRASAIIIALRSEE